MLSNAGEHGFIPLAKGRAVNNLPEEVKKYDIHRIALRFVDWMSGLPRLFQGRVIFTADFDLTANVRISTKKSPAEVDDAGK
ncbi:hypothetical protein D9M70_454110 [compost metagenome]